MGTEQEKVKALRNQMRAEIYAELRLAEEQGRGPTISTAELREHLIEAGHEVDQASLAYHLLQLERVGLIVLDGRGCRSLR
jgi:DNA-binding transcriptional ArsR family regulator